MYSDLRPAVMDVLELKSALQWQVRKFRARTRIPCKLAYQIQGLSLDENCCTAVFRICQEVLNQVPEHAKASAVEIEVKQDRDHALLEVGYHGNPSGGRAASPAQVLRSVALHEFVLAVGGELHVQENARQGTLISARVPIKKAGFNWAYRPPRANAKPLRRRSK
jgi:glucose-6-phosphate-specific signal transduction histidine kinase